MQQNNHHNVKILSIESFKHSHLRRQQSVDNEVPSHGQANMQRLLSIPDVLLNATAAAAAASGSSSASNFMHHHPTAPRTRIVNMFANSEQTRPVYAPKHPVDLEGLQETAV